MRAHARAVGGGGLRLGARGQRIQVGRLLIAAQVALSLVLLVGAGLLVRSLRSLQHGEVGLDRDHLLIVDVDVGARGYGGARRGALVRTLAERFELVHLEATGFVRPGVPAFWWMLQLLPGDFAAAAHAANIVLHGVNAALVSLVAWAGACLFAWWVSRGLVHLMPSVREEWLPLFDSYGVDTNNSSIAMKIGGLPSKPLLPVNDSPTVESRSMSATVRVWPSLKNQESPS